MEDKRTVFEWMNKLNVRPAIHNEELYKDNTEYTLEEFNKLVPYETQVVLYNETAEKFKELSEEDLKLSVLDIQLGTLKTNALAIKKKIEEKIPTYDAKNYNEENIKKATDDRALLNNTAKYLNKERIELEKKFLKPFEEQFKDIITKTITIINEASSKIDTIVKEVENRAKEEKKQEVLNLFNTLIENEPVKELVKFEMLFEDKFLNKTCKITEIETTLKDKISKINADINAIKMLESEYEISLINNYLKDFSLSNAITEHNRLLELKKATVKVEEKTEEIRQEKIEVMTTVAVESEDDDPIKTYTLEINGTPKQYKEILEFLETNEMEHQVYIKTKGTLSQQKKLKELLELNKMQFKKVE